MKNMKRSLIEYSIILILLTVISIFLPKDKPSKDISAALNIKPEEAINDEVFYKNGTYENRTYKSNSDEIGTYREVTYEDDMSFCNSPPKIEEVTATFDEELHTKLAELLGDNIYNVGVVYYNLSSKEYVTINEDMDFVAASTYKVGLNLLYYYLANDGTISLDDTITYTDQFYADGTGILLGYCYPNMAIPISELLDLSIIYSDNIATSMLSSYLGGYNAVREKLYGLLNIDYILYDNVITPSISAKILKYIYDNKNLEGFAHLIEVMKNTVFHDRLDKYIPQILTAHKIGSIDNYAHDIGLVFTDEPYLISIYTKDLANADEIIAKLSKIIYNKHTNYITQIQINSTLHEKK